MTEARLSPRLTGHPVGAPTTGETCSRGRPPVLEWSEHIMLTTTAQRVRSRAGPLPGVPGSNGGSHGAKEASVKVRRDEATRVEARRKEDAYVSNRREEDAYVEARRKEDTTVRIRREEDAYVETRRKEDAAVSYRRENSAYVEARREEDAYVSNRREEDAYVEARRKEDTTVKV